MKVDCKYFRAFEQASGPGPRGMQTLDSCGKCSPKIVLKSL